MKKRLSEIKIWLFPIEVAYINFSKRNFTNNMCSAATIKTKWSASFRIRTIVAEFLGVNEASLVEFINAFIVHAWVTAQVKQID